MATEIEITIFAVFFLHRGPARLDHTWITTKGVRPVISSSNLLNDSSLFSSQHTVQFRLFVKRIFPMQPVLGAIRTRSKHILHSVASLFSFKCCKLIRLFCSGVSHGETFHTTKFLHPCFWAERDFMILIGCHLYNQFYSRIFCVNSAVRYCLRMLSMASKVIETWRSTASILLLLNICFVNDTGTAIAT